MGSLVLTFHNQTCLFPRSSTATDKGGGWNETLSRINIVAVTIQMETKMMEKAQRSSVINTGSFLHFVPKALRGARNVLNIGRKDRAR
jgi:hypothetical protein